MMKLTVINGKRAKLPMSMYTQRDLEEMELDFVENSILFNRSRYDKK